MFDSEYLLETVARNRKKKPDNSDFISKLRIDLEKAANFGQGGKEEKSMDENKYSINLISPKSKKRKPSSRPDTPYVNSTKSLKKDGLRRSSNSIKFTEAIKEKLAAFSSARSLKALPNKSAKLSNSSSVVSGLYQDQGPSVQPFLESSKVFSFKDSSLGSKSISKKGSNQSLGAQSHKSLNSGSFDQSRELERKLNLSSQANKNEFEMFKQSLRFESPTLDLFAEIKQSNKQIGYDCIDEEVQFFDRSEKRDQDQEIELMRDELGTKPCGLVPFDLSLIEEASHNYEQTPNNLLSPAHNDKTRTREGSLTNLAEREETTVRRTQNTLRSLEIPPSKELKTFVYRMKVAEDAMNLNDLTDSPEKPQKTNQIDYEDGSRYTGAIEEGKRHGVGALILPDKSKMEGDWRNDILHGEGRLYYASGRLAYEGYFKQGQLNGHGVMYAEDCSQKSLGARGQVENPPKSQNSYTDYKVLDYQNLNKTFEHWSNFEGCFQDDMKTGIGIMEMRNGDIFMGEFANDMANGPGSYQTNRGVKFLGVWRDNYLVYELMLPSGMQTDKTKLTF